MVKMQNNPVKGIWMDGHAVNKITVFDNLTGQRDIVVETINVENVLSQDYCNYNDNGSSDEYQMSSKCSIRSMDAHIYLGTTKLIDKNNVIYFDLTINKYCRLYAVSRVSGTLRELILKMVLDGVTYDLAVNYLAMRRLFEFDLSLKYNKVDYASKEFGTYSVSVIFSKDASIAQQEDFVKITKSLREEFGIFYCRTNRLLETQYLDHLTKFKGSITLGIVGSK